LAAPVKVATAGATGVEEPAYDQIPVEAAATGEDQEPVPYEVDTAATGVPETARVLEVQSDHVASQVDEVETAATGVPEVLVLTQSLQVPEATDEVETAATGLLEVLETQSLQVGS